MKDIQEIKNWIQQKIDFWQYEVDSHPNDFETFTGIGLGLKIYIGETWRTGISRGQEKGILLAYQTIKADLEK